MLPECPRTGSLSLRPFLTRLLALLALAGLASMSSPALAQLPLAEAIVPGEVTLDLSTSTESTLGIELEDVELALCGRRGGLAECGLPISRDGILEPLVLAVTGVQLGKGGEAAAAVVPQTFQLTGPPLATVCGRWRYRITLDPLAAQETSRIGLHPPLEQNAPTAAFDTTLDLGVRLYFEPEDGGRTVDIPMDLSLVMDGRWTVLLSEAMRGQLSRMPSNLVLLVEKYGGTWIPAPTLVTGSASLTGTGSPAARCGHRMLMQAPQDAIVGLNGGGRKGMSWGKMAHHTAWGVDQVGCQGCDAYAGDTACSLPLPLLCLNPDGSPPPPGLAIDFYNGWAGGNIGLTAPVRGDQLASPAQADGICQIAFGPGYRMAELHDGGGGWSWYSRGNIDATRRFWVHVDDTAANCWNP